MTCLCWAPAATATDPGRILSPQGDPDSPWHLSADHIAFDQRNDRYVATGNVVIEKDDRKLSADKVLFDHKAMAVWAGGHVTMSVGDDILVGRRLEMDLNSETGTLYDGSIFYAENHFYIKGDKIQKVGRQTYTMDKGSVTTCDGDRPAWRITGRNMRVTIEGYGQVQHATLWARDLPVGYVPYLLFPVKIKRQSGLLAPQFGVSDRKGFYYSQPLYWAISPSADATFYWHHMSRRGEKPGAEFRYFLDEASRGLWRYDVLEDRKIDDGTGNSSSLWGYTGDSILRPNADRYWLRMKHDQKLPSGFFARMDVDVVSDPDYLHEFMDGYTGFTETRKVFRETFGRDIDDYTDTVRTNRLNINKSWGRYSFNADLQYYDDVPARRSGQPDTTLQRLPSISFDGAKQPLAGTPFFYDLSSEYVYFYRQDGNRAHRSDLYPRFYWPVTPFEHLSVEPSAGIRETVWQMESYEDGSTGKDRFFTRELYDFKVDLTSELSKIYTRPGTETYKIKHVLRPRVVYEYVPDINQDDLPSFDAVDRIPRTHKITYSLTSFFTGRSPNPARAASPGAPPHVYRNLGRLKLEQSYAIESEDGTDGEPFSDIIADLEWYPFTNLTLDADAAWSPYDYGFNRQNISVSWSDRRGDSLSAGYRYTKDQSESIRTRLQVVLWEQLSGFGRYEYNIMENEQLELSLGFLYNRQCWSFQCRFTEEGPGDDQRLEFIVTLHGLGEFGQSVSTPE